MTGIRFICHGNIRNMLRLFGGVPGEKVHRRMDYTDCGGDAADPRYSERFDVAGSIDAYPKRKKGKERCLLLQTKSPL